MLSRDILKDMKQLHVYLDSETFEELLDKKNKVAVALLNHHRSMFLDVIRNPFESKHKELKEILEFKITNSQDSEIKSIEVVKSEHVYSSHGFSYKMKDVIHIAEVVYGKQNVKPDELNSIINVFIQAVFNRFEKSNIYITNNKTILKNRLWFECHFPGYSLNIMTVQEASVFIDLFFKNKGFSYISCSFAVNKGYWYFLSMRLLLPHYNVGDTYLDALSHRVYYMLMSLDEMAVQFYKGVNNDTMDFTLYHFNYFVGLTTGIFDNLALKTNAHLNINFQYKSKMGLHNKEFLAEIRDKNPQIRAHINAYVDFINAIYLLREQIIHRDLLEDVRFENRDNGNSWKANFVRIPKELVECLNRLGDKPTEFDPFSEWGVYILHSEIFLEPYCFSIAAVRMLGKFVDKYLELLGYPSFIENMENHKDFADTMKRYMQYRLGYRWEDN